MHHMVLIEMRSELLAEYDSGVSAYVIHRKHFLYPFFIHTFFMHCKMLPTDWILHLIGVQTIALLAFEHAPALPFHLERCMCSPIQQKEAKKTEQNPKRMESLVVLIYTSSVPIFTLQTHHHSCHILYGIRHRVKVFFSCCFFFLFVLPLSSLCFNTFFLFACDHQLSLPPSNRLFAPLNDRHTKIYTIITRLRANVYICTHFPLVKYNNKYRYIDIFNHLKV